MQTSLLLVALCLLASVNLRGTESTTGPPAGISGTSVSTAAPPPTTGKPSTDPTGNTPGSTANQTEKPDTSPTEEAHTDATQATITTTEAPATNGTQGLSGGAIAGIVIGTVAGVGLLGGGVYGLLKYTDKI